MSPPNPAPLRLSMTPEQFEAFKAGRVVPQTVAVSAGEEQQAKVKIDRTGAVAGVTLVTAERIIELLLDARTPAEQLREREDDLAGWQRQFDRVMSHIESTPIGVTPGTLPRPAARGSRPRERRCGQRRSTRGSPSSDPSDPDPPPALPQPAAEVTDSGLNVVLRTAYAHELTALECFEAAAILELRGELLVRGAA